MIGKCLFGMALAATLMSGASFANDSCDATVTGPGTGADVQAAIDAAAPGQTICLAGTFTQAALSVPASKVGLTITSLDKNSPATLQNRPADFGAPLTTLVGFTFENGAEAVTIRDLVIDVTQFSISSFGNTSNITVMNNQVVGAIVANSSGPPDTGWVVQNNTIVTDSVGVGAFHSQNTLIKDNHITFIPEIFGPVRPFHAGVTVIAVADTPDPLSLTGIKIMDNVIEYSGAESLPKFGVFVDANRFAPFASTDLLISNVNIQRNVMTNVDTGIFAWMTGGAGIFESDLTDIDALKNDIQCSGAGGTGILLQGEAPGSVADVQLINNDITGCDVEISENGDVSGVRLLGKGQRGNSQAPASAQTADASEDRMRRQGE